MKKISELINLEGRSAIVTGGGGHIGLAISETFMELGAKVCIVDTTEEACLQRCSDLNARGYKNIAIPSVIDVSNEKDLRNAIHKAAKAMGGIDIIVHSAAFVGTTDFPGWVVPFKEQTTEAWSACMKVNLDAAFIMVQEALEYLEKSEHSSVIFVSSIHGMVGPDMGLYEGTPMGNPAAYGVSKAGLIQMARYLATVLPNIRVNTISPGGVWRNQHEEFHKRYNKRTPVGKMAIEEDFKGAFAFLASDLSKYVTGQNLVVDGGYTAW